MSGVGPKLAQKIGAGRVEFDAAAELALCRRLGVSIVARGEAGIPRLLENIPDPPVLLYIRGTIEPRDELAIALVGSRRCTPYGARMAERLARALARTGFTVVSGLARGIDAAAPPGAISAGGRSIAVLANGLSSIYPPEHEDLALRRRRVRRARERDADAADAVARALHPAKPDHFRDRARGRGGRSDAAQRVAFDGAPCDRAEPRGIRRARPGRQSVEPRLPRLIRDGARLVETVDDIIEELGPLSHEIRADPGEPPVRHPAELALSDSERSLLGQLDDQPSGVDELIVRTGMTAAQVLATLSVLEVKRLAKRLAGHSSFGL